MHYQISLRSHSVHASHLYVGTCRRRPMFPLLATIPKSASSRAITAPLSGLETSKLSRGARAWAGRAAGAGEASPPARLRATRTNCRRECL